VTLVAGRTVWLRPFHVALKRIWIMRQAGKAGLGLLTVAIAGLAMISQVAGSETLLRKINYLDRGVEAYLPPASAAVPWLDLDQKTTLPKGDYPIGRDATTVPFMKHADVAEFALDGG
jgi:hypothetical protein